MHKYSIHMYCLFLSGLFAMGGCTARSPIPAIVNDPYSYGPNATEQDYPLNVDIAYTREDAGLIQKRITYLRSYLMAPEGLSVTQLQNWRNEFIFLKMNSIDKAYFIYEEKLTHDDSTINLVGTITSLGLTTAASAIPAGQTTKILAAAATAVGASNVAYDKDLLLSQTIQALESQMRTDRANVAADIFNRATCPLTQYPMGLVFADLENYERAGTLASAIIGVNKTVAAANASADANKNASGAAPGNKATTQSQKSAASALVQLTTATATLQKIKQPCPLG